MKQLKKMKSYRLDEMTIWKIEKTAADKGISQTQVIENAVNMYRFIFCLDDKNAGAITGDWLKYHFDLF